MKRQELKTLAEIIQIINNENSNFPLFNHCRRNFIWDTVYEKDFVEQILGIAHFLEEKGLKKGDKMLIFSRNSFSWFSIDLACQLLGIITVPIFIGITKEILNFQIKKSATKFAFIYCEEEWNETEFIHEEFEFIITKEYKGNDKTFPLTDISAKKMSNKEIQKKYNNVHEDDIATIVYSSGSYGYDKAAILTHKNIISQIHSAQEHFYLPRGTKVMSFLPVNHIFQRITNYIYITHRLEIFHLNNKETLMVTLKEIEPIFITTVPRVLEKIYLGLLAKSKSYTYYERIVVEIAIWLAHTPHNRYKRIKRIFRKVYHRFSRGLGLQNATIVSGGAKLGKKVNNFFLNLGITLHQGYGLTETAAFVTLSSPNSFKFDSVGKATGNTEIKISSDKEILIKGDAVMQGYYDNEKENKQVFDKDGWLKTGDLGKIDAEGFLFITGRKKNLLKNSNGKYISTVPLQTKINLIPKIEHGLIIGENKAYVIALLFVDKKLTAQEEKEIENSIKKINKKFNNWETIKKYKIITHKLNMKKGELTPSFKICHNVVEKKYIKIIEDLYKS